MIYAFECKECGFRFDEWLSLSDCEKRPPCPECKGKSRKDYSSIVVNGDDMKTDERRGFAIASGVNTRSKSEKRKIMKEKGLIEDPPRQPSDYEKKKKRKQRSDRDYKKALDRAYNKTRVLGRV